MVCCAVQVWVIGALFLPDRGTVREKIAEDV